MPHPNWTIRGGLRRLLQAPAVHPVSSRNRVDWHPIDRPLVVHHLIPQGVWNLQLGISPAHVWPAACQRPRTCPRPGRGFRGGSRLAQGARHHAHPRAAGCQLGGGFYLTNEKTGHGGKAELVSRLRIRAVVDDRTEICAEIRRTGCYVMTFDQGDWIHDTSSALQQVLTDYIWSFQEHWDAHHPLKPFVLDQYSGQPRGGRKRR